MDRLMKLSTSALKPKSKVDGHDSLHDSHHRPSLLTASGSGSLTRVGSNGSTGTAHDDDSFSRVASGSGNLRHHRGHGGQPQHLGQSSSMGEEDEGGQSPLGRQLKLVRDHVSYSHEEEEKPFKKTQFLHSTIEDVLLDDDEDDAKVMVGTEGRRQSLVADLLQPHYTHEERPGSRGGTANESSVTVAGMTKLRYEASHHEDMFSAKEEGGEYHIRLDIAPRPSVNIAAADRERLRQKRQEAKKVVVQAYKAVLGRLVDAAGLKHYTTCMVEEGVDRDELVMMLCRSHEFRQKQLDRYEMLPERTRDEWENVIYPWIAIEDRADFEPGTVAWQRNDEKKKDRMWMTGNVQGNNRGMEVFEGRLVYSIMDNWKTVCTETGFSNGVHWWSVSKMMRSHAGEKGRLGVVVMDTELDTDLKKEGAFKGRAFYITEDGNIWDGDCFISKGVDFYAVGYVVTMRLDCYTGELAFWVASRAPEGHSKDPYVLQGEEMGTFCGTIKIPRKAVRAGLYPFVQDMYGGSSWSFSKFETEGPDALADREKWVEEQALEIQKAMGVASAAAPVVLEHEEEDKDASALKHRDGRRTSLLGTDMKKAAFDTPIRVKAMPVFPRSNKNLAMTMALPSPLESLEGSGSFQRSQSSMVTSQTRAMAARGGSGSFRRPPVDAASSKKKGRLSMITSAISPGLGSAKASPANFSDSFRRSSSGKVPTAEEFSRSFSNLK